MLYRFAYKSFPSAWKMLTFSYSFYSESLVVLLIMEKEDDIDSE